MDDKLKEALIVIFERAKNVTRKMHGDGLNSFELQIADNGFTVEILNLDSRGSNKDVFDLVEKYFNKINGKILLQRKEDEIKSLQAEIEKIRKDMEFIENCK